MKKLLLNKLFDFKSLENLDSCKVFESKIKAKIEYYGDDITELCKKYKVIRKYLLISLIGITVLGLVLIKLLLFFDIPLALLAYFYPILYTWSKREDFKKVINLEATFITLVAYVNSLVDKSLLYTLKELSEIKELKVPLVEYKILTKMTDYMGLSYINALQKRAEIHRTDLLGKLYNNYLTAINLGVTVKDRLRDVLNDILFDLKESYKSYLEKSAELAEIEFAVLLLLPIVLIGFAFTFKISFVQLFMPLVFIPPLLFAISTLHPGIDYNIKYGRIIYALIVIPVVALLPLLNITYKLSLILAILLIFSFFVYRQITLANELENSLPLIIKEISEYLRIGYTISNSIPKIRLNSKRVLDSINKIIKDPYYESPSKLFNITMRLLLVTSKTGSSSVALQELANSINEILYVKQSLIRQLRLYDFMSALTPVMLWLAFGTLNKIISSVIPEIDIITAYSIGSTIILSKISRFTIFYFPSILMITVILIILSFMPPVLI